MTQVLRPVEVVLEEDYVLFRINSSTSIKYLDEIEARLAKEGVRFTGRKERGAGTTIHVSFQVYHIGDNHEAFIRELAFEYGDQVRNFPGLDTFPLEPFKQYLLEDGWKMDWERHGVQRFTLGENSFLLPETKMTPGYSQMLVDAIDAYACSENLPTFMVFENLRDR